MDARVAGAVRAGLAVFVLAWVFGPSELRSTVPLWLPFLIALGLELNFFVGALRPAAAGRSRPDRLPQEVDRDRYGYRAETDELVLVERDGEEVWLPAEGEEAEPLEAEPYVPERRGRPVRQLLVGLGVIGALLLVVWVAEARGGWNGLDPDTQAEAAARFSDEASRIAGHEASIHCDEAGDFVGVVQHADGVATVGGRLAFLTPERCYDLYRLAFKGEADGQSGRALAVLAHEAWHLNGVRNEGVTECYALQSGVDVGVRLGLSEGTARRLMRQQLAENAGRTGIEYIVPPGCRNGGELDLHPGEPDFP